MLALRQACKVVVPPGRPARIKTDRRDALVLARKLRAGELTAAWVPDVEQDASQQQILREYLGPYPRPKN